MLWGHSIILSVGWRNKFLAFTVLLSFFFFRMGSLAFVFGSFPEDSPFEPSVFYFFLGINCILIFYFYFGEKRKKPFLVM